MAILVLALASVPLVEGAAVPAQVSITGPAYALVGAPVTFEGTHSARAGVLIPLPATDVVLLLDEVEVGSDTTTLGLGAGRYAIDATFPTRGAYVVRAVADAGGPAEARSADLLVRGAVVPSPPRNVVASVIPGAPSARISWDEPADDGGAPVMNYVVQRRDTPTGLFATRATLTSAPRVYDDGGLQFGKSYTYRVLAVSAVGQSAPADAIISGDAPPVPVVTATPVHLSADAQVHIEPAGGTTQGLLIERSTNGGATWQPVASFSGTAARTVTDTLWFDSHPIYRGVALTVAARTAGAAVAPTGAPPGAPGTPTTWIDGENALIHVNWSAPATGGPVQGWRLLVDGAQRYHLAPEVGTSWAFAPDVGAHTYAIVASSMLGDGPASGSASLTIDRASAPSVSVTVVEETERARAELSWTTPVTDGGSPIRSYQVYRAIDGGSPTRVGGTSADELAYVDPSVPDGHSFTYSVHAVTTVGAGLDGTVSGSVASFDWALTHDVLHFTACEGTACTSVAPDGTYHRAGTGAVQYSVTYGGQLTRRGDPAAGVKFLVDIWETNDTDGELTEGWLVTTDAGGNYSASWTRNTALTPVGCVPVRFNSVTWYRSESSRREADSFTICP